MVLTLPSDLEAFTDDYTSAGIYALDIQKPGGIGGSTTGPSGSTDSTTPIMSCTSARRRTCLHAWRIIGRRVASERVAPRVSRTGLSR